MNAIIPPLTPSDLIKRFEGCRLQSYPDPASGGAPWTIGYGCTGPDIGPGTVWTQEQCDAELQRRLVQLETQMRDLVKVSTSPNQWAALCSLAWNIGLRAFSESTLLRALNERNMPGAAAQFLVWRRAAGHIDPALVYRRAEEQKIFLEGPPLGPLPPPQSAA